MTFVEHVRRNSLMAIFGALALAAVITMIFMDEPRDLGTLLLFVVALPLSYAVIIGVWGYFVTGSGRSR